MSLLESFGRSRGFLGHGEWSVIRDVMLALTGNAQS